MERGDVFIANTLMCRPPGNRDPLPIEIKNCQDYLLRKVELIEPTVICTLGNFSTKLLRGDPTGITRLHGQPEVLVLGHRAVRLYPIYHPAAALYTPRMLETLREDFTRLPELLALGAPEQPLFEEAPELSQAPDLLADGVRQRAPTVARIGRSWGRGRPAWPVLDARLLEFPLQRRGFRRSVEKCRAGPKVVRQGCR